MANKIMQLKIETRISLLSILPEKGDITDMCVKIDLRRKLSLSKKEKSKFKLTSGENGQLIIGIGEKEDSVKTLIKALNEYKRQYSFDEHEDRLITNQLKSLGEKKELREDLALPYRWFVENKPCEYPDLEAIEPDELKDYVIPEEATVAEKPSQAA